MSEPLTISSDHVLLEREGAAPLAVRFEDLRAFRDGSADYVDIECGVPRTD